MNDVRVIIAAPTMARGGTERQLVHLAAALPPLGIDPTFVLLTPDGPLAPELAATGARVIKPARRYPRPLRTWVQARLIAREIKAMRPHVVHSFLSEPHFAAALGIALAGGPRPLLVHGRRSTSFYARHRPIAARLERALHGQCAALIGNSTALADELVREAGTPEKVAIIHNGAPIAALDAARPTRTEARGRLGIDKNAFVMAVVANLYAYKRHADVIDALAPIAEHLPPDWQLILAGREGGERERLEAQVTALGLVDHVRFLGEVIDVNAVHAAADIEILASVQEGFSNALLEAMAASLPCIVSDAGGNPDTVVHEETGVVLPVQAPVLLGAAILSLARDPDLRRRYGSAGRARVERYFDIATAAARHAELWRGLAAHPDQPVADWFSPPEPCKQTKPPR